ncbi:MAG: glycosyltransferase, partial [Myxococcales bacterium]|nr:glycosyltransferase [Myxococcales bacterium]
MSVRKSIVVPCYNEAKNLPNLIARFEALVPDDRTKLDWELLLVNK